MGAMRLGQAKSPVSVGAQKRMLNDITLSGALVLVVLCAAMPRNAQNAMKRVVMAFFIFNQKFICKYSARDWIAVCANRKNKGKTAQNVCVVFGDKINNAIFATPKLM